MAITNALEAVKKIANVDPSKIQGLNAVILFNLTGEGGGKWTLKFENGKVEVNEGETASPNMTLSMSAQDFVDLSNGTLNPMAAFMQGKLKISGDMSLAMRLQSLLT